jgi:hypothetical protein
MLAVIFTGNENIMPSSSGFKLPFVFADAFIVIVIVTVAPDINVTSALGLN